MNSSLTWAVLWVSFPNSRYSSFEKSHLNQLVCILKQCNIKFWNDKEKIKFDIYIYVNKITIKQKFKIHEHLRSNDINLKLYWSSFRFEMKFTNQGYIWNEVKNTLRSQKIILCIHAIYFKQWNFYYLGIFSKAFSNKIDILWVHFLKY